MPEKIVCVNGICRKEFMYESEIVSGASKNIGEEKQRLGESKGLFAKKTPKKIPTLLVCPHCKTEDYYKVTVGG